MLKPHLCFQGLGLDQNGINEKVLVLLYVSIQWFLFKPSDPFFCLFVFSSLHCRIFLSLMEAADLTDLLKHEGDFTLFAPSDKAFAGLTDRDLTLLKRKDPRRIPRWMLSSFSFSTIDAAVG